MSETKKLPACKLALYPLTCAHCGCEFQGTYKQKQSAKSEGTSPLCSKACRLAYLAKKFATPIPMRGPCQHCGKMFASRRNAEFCNISCYTSSKRFIDVMESARKKALSLESREKLALALRTGGMVPCLNCQTEFYRKKSLSSGIRRRLFCSHPCYRAYLAARYDRWIANPQTMSLPQAYDEFLDRHELNCLVEGCDWRGVHLSNHVNIAHGITAREFKRAAGFNLSTGLVGSEMARRLSERAKVGVAAVGWNLDEAARRLSKETQAAPDFIRYQSLEGAEHRAKAGLFTRLLAGPTRKCAGCGEDFTQSTPMGRSKYCSVPCRSRAYRKQIAGVSHD